MNRTSVVFLGAALLASASCSDGFGRPRGQQRLTVELIGGNVRANGACTHNYECELPLGCVDVMPNVRQCRNTSAVNPRPVKVDGAETFRIIVKALRLDGAQDESFSGFVRISAKPGSIAPITAPGVAEGRNVRVEGGASKPVEVRLVNAYGVAYILADALGYEPVDPFGDPAPACSDGFDNDGDGRIDFPADEGCAFANDANEGGASYAQGASPPLFFALPRIAQVRGVTCPSGTCSGTGLTPYPKEQIQIDTGYRERIDQPPIFAFDVVVSRISSDGFYAQDLGAFEAGFGGFSGIFAFNFNAPPRMRVCNGLKTFTGTANEFFGFTQVAYPTWTLEEWDPAKRLCLVPEPDNIAPADAASETDLLPKSGKLVRVRTGDPNPGQSIRPTEVRISPKLGPGDAQRTPTGFVFGPGIENDMIDLSKPVFTNCDFNKDARIDFGNADPDLPQDPLERDRRCNDLSLVPMPGYCEGVCSNACDRDPECAEFSNYRARSTFRLYLKDALGTRSAVQADASAFAGFNPLASRGKLIRAFSGTLHYFSGGSQFTIEARCKDDVVLELDQQPLPNDRECTDNMMCPAGLSCIPIENGQRACRSLDKLMRPSTAPPLTCVFPRTFLDNNPQ